MSSIFLARAALVSLSLFVGPVISAEVTVAPRPGASAELFASPYTIPLRIVVVHWKIKPGQEGEFLNYWSHRAVVEDRSGLVSEYLSSVEDQERTPWVLWPTLSSVYTSYFNVGIWRNLDAFQSQIGRYIDNSRPPLPFEAERRERVLLVPERWRTGGSALPATDAPGVK